MGPKKVSNSGKPKRKAAKRTIELKKELIAKFESGARVSDLANEYGMAKSTVSSILKNKEVIKEVNVAKGVTVLSANRSPVIEEMEKLLLLWVNEKKLNGESVTDTIICEKAKELHDDLTRYIPGTSAQGDEFKASRGWVCRFKKRSGIQSGSWHREIASANSDDAGKFAEEFKNFVDSEGVTPHQVFNCYETNLFWKMPKRTNKPEENSVPGHKYKEDKLALLLCSNASGDLKCKPLLVYQSENPKVFKKNNVIKSKLSVMWRANRKAWITKQFFTEWIHEIFVPSVKNYLEEKNLPLKVLLVMDNTPAHPPDLEEDLVSEYSFIQLKFLPPTIAPLIQPMDQPISNFKKLYAKALFQRCLEVTSVTELTLWDFWMNHFNILHCLRLIDKAWGQISSGMLNSAWKRLWPECVQAKSFEDLEIDPEEEAEVVNELVLFGKSIGLGVDIKDELTIEELQELKREQQEVAEELSSEEEEMSKGSISTSEIKELCYHWERLQSLVEKWHPNIAVVNRSINQFDDNVIGHFRKIFKNRQRQTAQQLVKGRMPSPSII